MTKNTDPIYRAAKLMRKRAEAATPGGWIHAGVVDVDYDDIVVSSESIDVVADTYTNTANAAHIASWSPNVALEVAEWLEEIYSAMNAARIEGRETIGPVGASEYKAARHIAKAYLGE